MVFTRLESDPFQWSEMMAQFCSFKMDEDWIVSDHWGPHVRILTKITISRGGKQVLGRYSSWIAAEDVKCLTVQLKVKKKARDLGSCNVYTK